MDKAWIGDAQNRIREKLHKTAERSAHKVPYTTRNGVFDDWTDNISWWTNGFWGGILWQLYHATKEKLYRELAVELEEKLDRTLMDPEGMDHDSGFRWLLTSGAHFRETGNEEAYRRTLLAACNMAGRFNPAGNFIRAWNDWGNKEARGENAGIAIIDCMMNLPLLYWASDVTGDPRFRQIAAAHADTAQAEVAEEVTEEEVTIKVALWDYSNTEYYKTIFDVFQFCGVCLCQTGI